jgi:hypothetical protein
MTLKFFAMFFMQHCDFSPVAVSLLGAAAPVCVSAASLAFQRVSRWWVCADGCGVLLTPAGLLRSASMWLCHGLQLPSMASCEPDEVKAAFRRPQPCARLPRFRRFACAGRRVASSKTGLETNGRGRAVCCARTGRVQICLLTRLVDILLFLLMAYLPTAAAGQKARLVLVHLTRMAVANATRPLMRSVLMDYVPKAHRAKVNALDSVTMLSWSGSAALGGCVCYAPSPYTAQCC